MQILFQKFELNIVGIKRLFWKPPVIFPNIDIRIFV